MNEPVEDLGDGQTASAAIDETLQTTSGIVIAAQGDVSANAGTGELKLNLNASQSDDFDDSQSDGAGRASIYARATISETFQIIGAGTVAFLMDYDASWLGQSVGLFGSVSSVQDFNDTAFTQPILPLNRRVNLIETGAGATSGTLIDNHLIEAGEIYNLTVRWILEGSAVTSDLNQLAFFDSSNTGRIRIEASEGVTVTASDSFFLSQVGQTNVVPLPAGAILLLSGLAGMAGVRRAVRMTKD